MKRVSAGKYEATANGHHYEVVRRDVPSVEWFVFRDKASQGSYKTYRDARAAVQNDVGGVSSDASQNSVEEAPREGGEFVLETSTPQAPEEEDFASESAVSVENVEDAEGSASLGEHEPEAHPHHHSHHHHQQIFTN